MHIVDQLMCIVLLALFYLEDYCVVMLFVIVRMEFGEGICQV